MSVNIEDIANPVKSVTDAIGQIKEIKTQREAEQNYTLLTAQQKKTLDKQIANARSEEERVAILSKSLLSVQTQQLEELKKRSKNNLYIFLGAASVFLITIILLKRSL